MGNLSEEEIGNLHNLENYHSYVFYEQSLLFSTKAKDKDIYFYSFFVDVVGGSTKFMHIPITLAELGKLESGCLSVWSFAKGKKGYAEYCDGSQSIFAKESVLDEYLPEKDIVINFDAENNNAVCSFLSDNGSN
jgi:hypothetical protein